MYSMMHMLVLRTLCLLSGYKFVLCTTESIGNNPVFNLDHTALEKNIAAIFNKVAHSSATTKRSVPAYEAQVSHSSTQSTSPSPPIASIAVSTTLFSMVSSRATSSPFYRELPSYAPPSRALFTPPLPPEYANPFADKPTLRGTNTDSHSNLRRPIPPPSYTPAHERIPIKPPDLVENTTKNIESHMAGKEKIMGSYRTPYELSKTEKDFNDTDEYVPSLHYTSISRILSGSNGRKQDIPEILLKPIPTKSSNSITTKDVDGRSTTTSYITKLTMPQEYAPTNPTIMIWTNKTNQSAADNELKNYQTQNGSYKIRDENIANGGKLPHSREQPLPYPSRVPEVNPNESEIELNIHPLETTWKIAWSLHVYLAATLFTLIALYSVYKIVRFNEATNLLSQSYFLTIHLLLTTVCTLRCFHLFYDAYNLSHSLPEIVSRLIMFLPSSFLAAAFATLILYMSRCSTAPFLYQNKLLSPVTILSAFIIHTVLCIFLQTSSFLFGYTDEAKILPLISQCIYILMCVSLGLFYMYVYRVLRSQLHLGNSKSMNNQITADFLTVTLNTAITTTIATALLFILMGFVQLYGVFEVRERFQPHPWLWWGWEFSVRLIELSVCGLLAWVASLSQYQIREKQIQQHVVHSGFALFPCGSSTSTENMDDALYPAICSTNHAIQNYTLRTGKQVYDDNFPLNTLPDNSNLNTFERHSTRNCSTLKHVPSEECNSFSQHKHGIQSLCRIDGRENNTPMARNINEQTSTSGSTMLVAEDGFVRFRNLGSEDDLSDSQSMVDDVARRNSLSCSSRVNIKQSKIVTRVTQNHNQNSLPHLHLSIHRNQSCTHDT